MSASSLCRLLPLVVCVQCIVVPSTNTTADTAETGTTSPSTADTAEEPAPYCAPEETPFPHCGCLTFATSIGSYFDDVGYALAPTSTGGVALAGEFTTTVTFGAGQTGETTLDGGSGPRSEGFVAVLSASGELLWVRQQSSFESTEAVAVAVDAPSGRVVGAGRYWSDLTVSGGGVQQVLPEEYQDAFVVSYDNAGTLQWAVYTQSDDRDEITALAFGASGELYVTGYSEAARVDVFSTNGSRLRLKDMGPGGYTGETSAFLLRIEADGTLTWAQRLIGTGFQELERLAVLSDGNLVVAGHFTTELLLDPGGPGELTLTPTGFPTFFAVYTASGALLSAQQNNATSVTDIAGLIPTSTGFVFAGRTGANTIWAAGTPQETTTVPISGVLARLGNDALFQSLSPFAAALSPAAATADATQTSFALAGRQSGSATYGLGEPNEVTVDADPRGTNAWDPVLLVLDDNGLLDCFWHLDGNETFDQAHGVAYDSGGVWVTGQFHDTLVLSEGRPDEITLHSVDDNDLFLARFSLRPPPQDTADTATPDTATNTALP